VEQTLNAYVSNVQGNTQHSNQKDNDAHQIKDDVVRRANVKSEVGAEVGVAKLLVVARQKARLVRKRLEATEIIASDLGLDEVQIDASGLDDWGSAGG